MPPASPATRTDRPTPAPCAGVEEQMRGGEGRQHRHPVDLEPAPAQPVDPGGRAGQRRRRARPSARIARGRASAIWRRRNGAAAATSLGAPLPGHGTRWRDRCRRATARSRRASGRAARRRRRRTRARRRHRRGSGVRRRPSPRRACRRRTAASGWASATRRRARAGCRRSGQPARRTSAAGAAAAGGTGPRRRAKRTARRRQRIDAGGDQPAECGGQLVA